jgi:MFS family permease
MIIQTAGLSLIAYGIINNTAVGAGKLAAVICLTFFGRRLTNVSFVALMFFLTATAIVWFGSSSSFHILMASAFVFGLGNIATNIANATISMTNTPSAILGRLMASRQVFVAVTSLVGTLLFGRLADTAGPPASIVLLGAVSGIGIVAVWLLTGQRLANLAPGTAQGGAAE